MSQWTVSSRRCNVCSVDNTVTSDQIQLCSGCRLIRYCSKKHQQLDWDIHKSFCKAIRHILKNSEIAHVLDLEGPVSSWSQFEKALTLNKCLLHTILKRQLDNHEIELLTFPVHCQICFSRNGKELFDCESCEAVSYCSLDHQKEDSSNHSKWCTHLKYYYNFYEIKGFKHDLDFTRAPIFDAVNFPKDLFSLIGTARTSGAEAKLSDAPKTLNDYQQYIAVSNFSCVATLLHAIKMCHLTADDKDVLSIYLIGSRDEHHYLEEAHCEFLASQLPTIREIELYLIGPEVPQPSKAIRYSLGFKENRKTSIKINFHREKFEDFVRHITSKVTLEKMPHLIAAFNCGFYEYAGSPKDTWKDGIAALFAFDSIPIVFTSYTKLESHFDLREFTVSATTVKREYRIVVNGEENPYKDYRPLRNMELHDRNDLVYFRNGYLHIIVISSEG